MAKVLYSIAMYIYNIHVYTYTMNAGKIIHRDIMLWHDKNSTLHRIYNHDFVFRFRMYMNEYLLRTNFHFLQPIDNNKIILFLKAIYH